MPLPPPPPPPPPLLQEYKKSPANSMWIVKPTARSQGKGIFLINKLAQVNAYKTTDDVVLSSY